MGRCSGFVDLSDLSTRPFLFRVARRRNLPDCEFASLHKYHLYFVFDLLSPRTCLLVYLFTCKKN